MTYDAEKIKLGRKPIVACGIVADYCTLTEGTMPCTSTATGDNKCFNTRASCNDIPNYTKGTKEYKFCQPRSDLPKGEAMFPVIEGNVIKSRTSITAGSGLGKRAITKIKLKDFPHHDRGIDKSVNDRTYDPMERGTFWGKWIKRNPYYEGRTFKVYYGYLTDPFDWANFEVEEFIIEDIDGPDNGFVTITAKDILVKTYGRKTTYPVLSNGKLQSDLEVGINVAILVPAGIGDQEYPASGTISIGKEAIAFTRTGDNLTLTRGQWGTTEVRHKGGDTVQLCATWDGTVSIIDMLYELLVTGSGIPAVNIAYADWVIERDQWMIDSKVKGILMKPEPIDKVINELSECFMFDIWWNSVTQEVRLKALAPDLGNVASSLFTEDSNIKRGTLSVRRKSSERFTEIQVYYDKSDFSEKNDIENFQRGRIAADLSKSGSDRYNGASIRQIFCRWYDDDALALSLAGRYLARYSDTPETVIFELDQKDDSKLEMGGRMRVNSWQFSDLTGNNETRTFQVIELDEKDEPGHSFLVTGFTSSFTGRYFFISPDGIPDFSAASDEQKESYGYISESNGLFADGSEGHKII